MGGGPVLHGFVGAHFVGETFILIVSFDDFDGIGVNHLKDLSGLLVLLEKASVGVLDVRFCLLGVGLWSCVRLLPLTILGYRPA